MPTVALVRGILILFYANDHDPPHFHAENADFSARIAIDDGALIDHVGKISASIRRLLAQWTRAHKDQLMENWRLARSHRPLKRIEG
jgi:hypothetical protein